MLISCSILKKKPAVRPDRDLDCIGMETNIEKKGENELELSITLPEDEMERYRTRAASDLSRTTQIKGFRRGHAPRRAVEAELGTDKVFERATELAVRESLVGILVERNIETVGDPQITLRTYAPGSPLSFTVLVKTLPEVEIKNYEKITIPQETVSIEKDEVDRALATLQRSRATYRQVTREAREGDRIEIDFDTMLAGVPLEGGSSRQHPLILREGHFLPGFEDELVGMHTGEKKTFSLIAPKDYHNKEVAGKELTFAVSMRQIQEVGLPALDNDFAKGIGKFESLVSLKESIESGMREEKETRRREKERMHIIEALIKETRFMVPEELISEELEKMERELAASLQDLNIDKESYLGHLGRSSEELRAGWQERRKSGFARLLF